MKTDLENIVESNTDSYKNNTMQIAVFKLTMNNTKFGINVNKVKSFLRFKDISVTKLADKNSLQKGFCIIRGVTYPLIDLDKWLGGESIEEDYDVLILAEFNKTHVAFPVKKIYRIYNKESSELVKNSLIEDKVTYITKITTGSDLDIKKEEEEPELCMILDVEKLLYEITGTQEIENSIGTMEATALSKEILVAEDSSMAILIITKILTKIGVTFKIFDNGEKLIDHLDSLSEESILKIGVILTDIEMPIKDGFQVIQHIKKTNNLKHLPIVVNSSMSNEGVKEKCKTLGAEMFIEKTEPETIAEVVKTYCK